MRRRRSRKGPLLGMRVNLIAGREGRLAHNAKGKAEQASSAIAPSTFASGAPGSGKRQHLTDGDWLDQWKPRVEGLMWSASGFDDRRAQSEPELYCMIGNDTGSCRCVTEQGTHALVALDRCRAYVKNGGVYNPFRRPRRERGDGEFSDRVRRSESQAQVDPPGRVDGSVGPGAFRGFAGGFRK